MKSFIFTVLLLFSQQRSITSRRFMSQKQSDIFPKMTRGKIRLPIDLGVSQPPNREQMNMNLSKSEHFTTQH